MLLASNRAGAGVNSRTAGKEKAAIRPPFPPACGPNRPLSDLTIIAVPMVRPVIVTVVVRAAVPTILAIVPLEADLPREIVEAAVEIAAFRPAQPATVAT